MKMHPAVDTLLKHGFVLFGKEWKRFTLFLALIPSFLLSLHFGLNYVFAQKYHGLVVNGLVGHFILQLIPLLAFILLMPVFFIVVTEMIQYQLYRVPKDPKLIPYKQVWPLVKQKYNALLGTSILQYFLIALAFIVPVEIGSVLGAGWIPLFTLIGLVASIVFTILFIFTPFIVVYDGLHYFNAIKKSYHLVHDAWWHVFGRILVFKIVTLALYAFLGIFFFPVYLSGFLLLLSDQIFLFTIVQFISGTVFLAAAIPEFTAISTYFMYLTHHDRRPKIQKHRAQKLGKTKKATKSTRKKSTKSSSKRSSASSKKN